ncbi:beta-propeller domain-containing protein [Nonomuraea lactucae]|uniref:beta-propeller domain-containing protein n=1 Tax=Nonomuraea lactucae TaxID=2249762 RepID=UPI000DE2766C|nr:beta-propeller domain-containing protein [Nonomuraea lactucae]
MKTLIRTAMAAAALLTATAACTPSAGDSARNADPSTAFPKRRLDAVRLVAYRGCDEMLAGLREHAAKSVGPWGFGGPRLLRMKPEDTAMSTEAKTADTPDHSTTNVHEAGVDEPDLVKTDGNRVITVSGGTLRVIDTATRKVTASLKLTKDGEPGYVPAELLVSGDRALVLMRGGEIAYKAIAPMGDTRYLLVDLAGEPKTLSTIKPRGGHVDARMVGSTVRLVTRSQPDFTFPQVRDGVSDKERKRLNQAAIRRAPIDAWLPKVEITDASGAVRTDSVACEKVSHPADYTGASLLTVHSIDLAQGVTTAGTDPISLAADGDIVYGTGQSLYVASNPHWWWPDDVILEDTPQAPATEPAPEEPTPSVTSPSEPAPSATASVSEPPRKQMPSPAVRPEETQVHRFDIGRPGAPVYAASGKVPGRLLNQYSLSEHDGHLRVATTTGSDGQRQSQSQSQVHVLRAADMTQVGEVGGLGKGEQIYSVRFIGPVGYVVTFKQVDPLYTLDLRDPAAPKVTGELKITGYSAYLHPAGDGRLIGIGQEASEQGRTLGTQVSLFDVRDPANPRRMSQLFQKDSGSEAEWDPHAFLYWPKTGLAVVPISSYAQESYQAGALALKIGDSAVTKLGLITHPPMRQGRSAYQPGIQRSIVIGDTLWTVSEGGVKVNDAASLADRAWIPFN